MGKTRHGYKIAYISRLTCPLFGANVIQTIQTAAEFARQTGNAHLFVRDMTCSEEQIQQQFAIDKLPHIWSLHARSWPSILYRSGWTRFVTYNSVIAAIFGFSSTWRSVSGQRNVLFVRSRAETLYWGLMRPYLRWLRHWVFVCEVHDIPLPMHHGRFDFNSSKARRIAKSLKNYDLVLAVSGGLAQDISDLTRGYITPKVIPCATGLQQLSEPPIVRFPSDRIVLGYTGTIDQPHGIEDLFQAMKLLPKNFILRIVGRVNPRYRARLDELVRDQSLSDKVELMPPKNYSEVQKEIDACDILLLPAGEAVHSRKYRSPLKLFDYMARGKPIVAAAVPCNLELLHHEKNAYIYEPGNAHELAAFIVKLVNHPQRAEAIAKTAWEQSANYTYHARIRRILHLLDEVWDRRGARRF